MRPTAIDTADNAKRRRLDDAASSDTTLVFAVQEKDTALETETGIEVSTLHHTRARRAQKAAELKAADKAQKILALMQLTKTEADIPTGAPAPAAPILEAAEAASKLPKVTLDASLTVTVSITNESANAHLDKSAAGLPSRPKRKRHVTFKSEREGESAISESDTDQKAFGTLAMTLSLDEEAPTELPAPLTGYNPFSFPTPFPWGFIPPCLYPGMWPLPAHASAAPPPPYPYPGASWPMPPYPPPVMWPMFPSYPATMWPMPGYYPWAAPYGAPPVQTTPSLSLKASKPAESSAKKAVSLPASVQTFFGTAASANNQADQQGAAAIEAIIENGLCLG